MSDLLILDFIKDVASSKDNWCGKFEYFIYSVIETNQIIGKIDRLML